LLSLLQILIINKGGIRVAEVVARFSLDALPGKQMAIEAEYNSGAISEEELIVKKTKLQDDIDFLSNMDGVIKLISLISKVVFFLLIGTILIIFILNKIGVGSVMENDAFILTICGIISQSIMILIYIIFISKITKGINNLNR
jgi:flagellar biosynthesis protein FlhA